MGDIDFRPDWARVAAGTIIVALLAGVVGLWANRSDLHDRLARTEDELAKIRNERDEALQTLAETPTSDSDREEARVAGLEAQRHLSLPAAGGKTVSIHALLVKSPGFDRPLVWLISDFEGLEAETAYNVVAHDCPSLEPIYLATPVTDPSGVAHGTTTNLALDPEATYWIGFEDPSTGVGGVRGKFFEGALEQVAADEPRC